MGRESDTRTCWKRPYAAALSYPQILGASKNWTKQLASPESEGAVNFKNICITTAERKCLLRKLPAPQVILLKSVWTVEQLSKLLSLSLAIDEALKSTRTTGLVMLGHHPFGLMNEHTIKASANCELMKKMQWLSSSGWQQNNTDNGVTNSSYCSR